MELGRRWGRQGQEQGKLTPMMAFEIMMLVFLSLFCPQLCVVSLMLSNFRIKQILWRSTVG